MEFNQYRGCAYLSCRNGPLRVLKWAVVIKATTSRDCLLRNRKLLIIAIRINSCLSKIWKVALQYQKTHSVPFLEFNLGIVNECESSHSYMLLSYVIPFSSFISIKFITNSISFRVCSEPEIVIRSISLLS